MSIPFKTRDQLIKELKGMREAQEALDVCRIEYQKSHEKYRDLLDSAPDAMIFVDRESRIVIANAQVGTLFGYTLQELEGMNLELLIPERYRLRHHEFVNRYFKHPQKRNLGANLEIYASRKEGTEFPADISLSPLQTEDGLLAVAAIRDITERKNFEEQIEKNYQIQKVISSVLEIALKPFSLQTIMEHILDHTLSIPHLALDGKGAIYVVDLERKVLVLTAQRGFSQEESMPCDTVPFGTCICGKAASHRTIIHAERIDERHEIIKEDIIPHGHYCVPITSGNTTLGLLNVFIRQGHKSNHAEMQFLTAVANSLAGIILHKHAEEEKEHLIQELSEAEKLAALGRVSANVAHEIRNPLTAVGGFARRLHKQLPEGSKEQEYADLIAEEVHQLEGILRKVLSYAQSGAPLLKAGDIQNIVETCIHFYHELFKEKHIVVKKDFHDVETVFIDEKQVREVMENLFSNAIDSMKDGGTLTIMIREEPVQDKPYILVSVQDTGQGITGDNLETIFEPFYTTKIENKGTGLGLSIVKKIIEAHNGFIQVESSPSVGTTFRLYFPAEIDNHEQGSAATKK